MRELVLAAAERGHSVRIHAIGDRAIHEALDIFGEAQAWYGAPMQGRRMRELVLAAAERGHSVRIHAIGDRAIHEALDIFGEAQAWYGAPMQGRNTLEHLENLLPQDIDRLSDLGILASSQPGHITLDPGGPERDLGPHARAPGEPVAPGHRPPVRPGDLGELPARAHHA